MVLLVNKYTASASEIMAGAIQDLDRGVIVGTKTFGKGLVQQVKDIDEDSKLKITISRYYTPSGRWIQEKNYFKENKYGVFMNSEPYIRSDIKTLGGRTVYANGGILPDILINTEPESDIHLALLIKDMFFRFSNYYLSKNPEIKIFKCTDQVFDEFKDFLISNNFVFKSDAYKKVEDLKQIASNKGYSAGINQDIEKLSNDLSSEYDTELEKAKEELKQSIESEINKRIVTEKEQIEALFPSDKQLEEAIRIIINVDEYKRILSGNN